MQIDGDKMTLDSLTINEDLFYYNNNLRYKSYEKSKNSNSEVIVKKED
jgi:hypothetical protein